MRADPQDWRIAELETIALAFGLKVRKSRGSHVVFWHPAVVEALTVPARRPIKPVYVRRFVALIDAVRGSDEQGHG